MGPQLGRSALAGTFNLADERCGRLDSEVAEFATSVNSWVYLEERDGFGFVAAFGRMHALVVGDEAVNKDEGDALFAVAHMGSQGCSVL
jgi:hypothetical protein